MNIVKCPYPVVFLDDGHNPKFSSIQPDFKYRSHDPVFYEHTLSPSAVRKRSARVRRYLSSNDETDDSIMKEISKYE